MRQFKVLRALQKQGVESVFSREHASYTAEGHCWLCHFPLGTERSHDDLKPSRDHVIPRSENKALAGNVIRTAHRYCNTLRKSLPVTPVVVRACRQGMILKHRDWLKWVGVKSISIIPPHLVPRSGGQQSPMKQGAD